ncbi:hypothetical protein Dd586_3780 [Dickeya parazeae Ech586]|uniref:Uncharacterized protein n=1 Tax=Dickeya zeae (strain Ech586) TaxID=590409 RepID=D2BY18_DICZ5|nr:hypothetical protein Dd586_3780 [Dickeya parazeae Ech586]
MLSLLALEFNAQRQHGDVTATIHACAVYNHPPSQQSFEG